MAHISRRIKNESKLWETRINENYHILNPTKIEICIFNIGYVNNLVFLFKISSEYPFKPPEIYLNGKNFKGYLPSGTLFRDDLKKILGSNCLCCNSITCNWGPTLNIINIVDEIREFLNIKLKLIEIFLTKKLVNIIPIELCENIIGYL
jgi:ubiquitin-protein ligase